MIQNQKVKSKRGQIQLTETVTVLFIFFILLVVGVSFYVKYQQKVVLEEKQETLRQARVLETALRAVSLPELQCTKGDAEPEEYCIDMGKARHFEEQLQEYFTSYYYDIFSSATITVHQLYPHEESWVLYNRPKEQAQGKKGSTSTRFVVTLRDDLRGGLLPAYGYGYLEVQVYS